MLQYANQAIDTVQGAKSNFVKTFIQDKEIAKSLQSFVDAQTEFTKVMVKSMYDVVTKVATDVVKYDYTKAFATK